MCLQRCFGGSLANFGRVLESFFGTIIWKICSEALQCLRQNLYSSGSDNIFNMIAIVIGHYNGPQNRQPEMHREIPQVCHQTFNLHVEKRYPNLISGHGIGVRDFRIHHGTFNMWGNLNEIIASVRSKSFRINFVTYSHIQTVGEGDGKSTCATVGKMSSVFSLDK